MTRKNYPKIAKEYIQQEAGNDFDIVEESIVDSELYYSFTYQSKEFLKTGDFKAMYVGQGYIFISKIDDRFFAYGSYLSYEEALELLTDNLSKESKIKRFKPEFDIKVRYDIQIKSIRKKWILIDLLLKYQTKYIIPEIAGETIYRIAKDYKRKDLEDKLNEKDFTFHQISITNGIYLIHDLIETQCCDFDLRLHTERKYEKYLEKASPEDLEPIW
jgi:hypothetical protein